MSFRLTSGRSILAANVLFLIAVSFVLFYRHAQYLAEGFDGRTFSLMVSQYFYWSPPGLSFSWNPMQALGLTPGFGESILTPNLWPYYAPLQEGYQKILSFQISAVQLFLSAFVFVVSLGFTVRQAACAAWACVLCVLPLHFQPVPLGQTFAISLPICHASSVSLLLLALFRLVGRPGVRFATMAGAFCCLAGILCVSSFGVGLVAPLVISAGLFILASSETCRELWAKLGALCLAIALLTVTGLLPWALGQVLQCARYSLNAEFPDNLPAVHLVSVFMSKAWFPKVLMVLALLGGGLLVAHKEREKKVFGGFILAYMAVIVVVGVFYLMKLDMRASLRPIYIEFSFLPFYAFGALYALGTFADAVRRRFRLTLPHWYTPKLLLAAGVLYLAVMSVSTFVLKKYPTEKPRQNDLDMVSVVKPELQVRIGDQFRGRIAWLTTWPEQTAQTGNAAQPVNALSLYRPVKLDFDQLNLAHQAFETFLEHNLPTAECYTQTLSVPYYLASSRLASQATWGPNFTYFSYMNVPFLASMGIRYVMTANPVSVPGAKLIAWRSFSSDGTPILRRDEPTAAASFDTSGGKPRSYMYELADFNQGQYSPTRVHTETSLNAALRRMGDSSFSFSGEVVLNEPLPESSPLVAASASRVSMQRGGIRVEATSPGTSLLVLPFEYMNGAEWIPDGNAQQEVRVYRANLVLVGLVFRGSIAGTLRFTPSMFRGGWGRLRDYNDMRKLDLKNLNRHELHGADAYYPSFMD